MYAVLYFFSDSISNKLLNRIPLHLMAISICAFNSTELGDEELMKDELNLFVKWELSDFFSDLILRRELVGELAELDQIGRIAGIDVEPLYAMSFYWDKDAETERLAGLNTEPERAKQLEIIQTTNESLLNNLGKVYQTVTLLEQQLVEIDDLEVLISYSNDGFFNRTYFTKNNLGTANFFSDLQKMKEFLEFAQSLDGDTVYFKFKPNSNQ